MPDFTGGGDLFRSRIMGQALEDTPYPQQAIAGMLGGATPEQMHAFFGSPQVQEQFRNFGIDPQAFMNVRQSPFFPNQFMQQHPGVGGFLTRGLANMAATPEAPLVSGAGSGLSRMAQGAYGGPEMLRQYQLHQMMAPLGMMGAMMPTYGEQRRRAIEEAIVGTEQARQKYMPQQAAMQQELSEAKSYADRVRADAALQQAEAAGLKAQTPKVVPGMGLIYPGQGLQTTTPAGMPPELGGQVAQGGDRFQPFDQGTVDAYIRAQIGAHPERKALADWRNALINEGVPEAEAGYYAQRAFEAQQKGQAAKTGGGKASPKQFMDLEGRKRQEYEKLEKEFSPYTGYQGEGKGAVEPPVPQGMSKEQWAAERQSRLAQLAARKQGIEDTYATERQIGGAPVPGYQYPGETSQYHPLAPRGGYGGATPNAGQPSYQW